MDLNTIARMETHAHSMYSNIRLLDSINRPKDLILTAAQLGLKGICLTDHECLCGAIEWLNLEQELKKAGEIPADFKCGVGNEIYLVDERIPKQKYYHFILIAKDTIGFHQLCELSSKSWYNAYHDRGMERVPTLKTELCEIVKKNPGHVIATTACIAGEAPQTILRLTDAEKQGDTAEAAAARQHLNEFMEFCTDIFGSDFYIEVAPSTNKEQIVYNKRIAGVAKAFGVKMIYGCDAHYLRAEDRYVHKAYLNSKEGEREIDSFYTFSRLMDNEEAWSYLQQSYEQDKFIELCDNSMEIYNKITSYDIFQNPIIPEVPIKNYPKREFSHSSAPTLTRLFNSDDIRERYWVNECWNSMVQEGWDSRENYVQRLETEADIIATIGQRLGNCLFQYFNTFQHYIDLFWECGSIVGPGRGSSVCFLSDRLMGITQLDPIEWGLAEWRFLNKERLELPDIDIDLAPSKRPLILKKIREERGEMRVLQVATFGTEGTKSAIVTACRGYRSEQYPDGIDSDTALYISSLIPQERGFLWSLDDVTKGNPEKDRKPIELFNREMEKYPGLLDIVYGIDGLVNKRSQHASGVILYNDDPWYTNAVMRSPNGDLTTQFDLHHSEQLGDTKFDFLVTEICDKLINCISLMQHDSILPPQLSLREIYDQYLHPNVIDWKDEKIWDTLATGEVVDLFQFDSDVGGQAIKSILPRNPLQMMMANALTRLTGEKGQERPIEKYVRFKNDMRLWYEECKHWGLTRDDIKILEPYYLPVCGVPTTQEKLMLLCMEPQLAHFTLQEANAARKVCSKKQLDKIPALKEKFISQCPRRELGEYVWFSAIEPQMSYAFAEPHALAYSFVAIQILILTTYYPIIYWNCACLITNSGGDEYQEEEDVEEDEDEEVLEEAFPEDEKQKKKKKTKTTDYGKVATAIGNFQSRGITITPPDINTSLFTFAPDTEHNAIVYGLRGITRLPIDGIKEIIAQRPYDSMQDFISKVKLNKVQMVNLIKSGAFDTIESRSREEIMASYIDLIAEKKQRLTLQNMQMLISQDLIPEEMVPCAKLFLFNKFLKAQKAKDEYILNDAAVNFISSHFSADYINNGSTVAVNTWDSLYQKGMDPMRNYLKTHKDAMLRELNDALYKEMFDKYASGNREQWSMEAVSFYQEKHELENAQKTYDDFFALSEEPEVDYSFPDPKTGNEIKVFRLRHIIGTVINKNKVKNTVTLLTPTGVVNVKVYKTQFALFDKQISQKQPDGTKKITEKSWFSRGSLLMVQGIRRGDSFVPKKRKDSFYPVISKITKVNPDGTLEFQTERTEVE